MIRFVSVLKSARFLLAATLLLVAATAACSRASFEQRFLDRAKKLIEQKQYDRAILELKNAARKQPADPEVYYQAGLAYWGIGDYRNAYQNLLRATQLDPKHVAAQNKLAELIGTSVGNTRDQQQLQEAEKRIQGVLAIVPDSGEALTALGRTEYMLGKPEDAIELLQTALEKAPRNLHAAWSLAIVKILQKDLAGAEQILKKSAADSPQSPEAQIELARLYSIAQRPVDAEAAYRRALSMNPKSGPALLELSRLLIHLGRKDDAENTLATLSALPDKEYRPLHAIYWFEQGRQDDAIREFEKQAHDDPENREAFTRLTSAYFLAKRFPDAERVVNAALKKNSKDTAALTQRSRLYLLTAKFSEAENDLNQVLKFDPNSALAHYLLSKVCAARGDELQARQQLSKAVDLKPDLLAARLALAEALTGTGPKAALELLDSAPADQKKLLPVIVARNWALFAARDTAQMRKSIDEGLRTFKRPPDLVLQDALLKFQSKDLLGARKSFEEVLAVRPSDTMALDSLAKTYVVEKKPDLALKTVEQYAARQPGAASMQALLGEWLAQNKRHDEARKAYMNALAADPTLARARMNLGLLDAADGKFDSARQTLSTLTTAGAPGLRSSAEAALGVLEEQAGSPAAAIPHFRKALDADPDNLTALNNLAYDLANSTDRFDEALQYAQKAKELYPRAWFVEDTIGWAFYRKGIYDSALIHLRNAASQEPTALRKYHLAMAYLKTGDRQRGRQTLDEARRMDPNLPEAAAAKQLMASLQ